MLDEVMTIIPINYVCILKSLLKFNFVIFILYLTLYKMYGTQSQTFSRSQQTLKCSFSQARVSGVLPLRLQRFLHLTPCKISIHTFKWPFSAAKWSGVLPLIHSDSGWWNSFGNWFCHLIVGNMSIVLNLYQQRPFFA